MHTVARLRAYLRSRAAVTEMEIGCHLLAAKAGVSWQADVKVAGSRARRFCLTPAVSKKRS